MTVSPEDAHLAAVLENYRVHTGMQYAVMRLPDGMMLLCEGRTAMVN